MIWTHRLQGFLSRWNLDASHSLQGEAWQGMTEAIKVKVAQATLEGAAPRTIGNYVRELEKYEKWLQTQPTAVRMNAASILGYVTYRLDGECGPAVLPAFRAALQWAHKRFALEVPQDVWEPYKALERKRLRDAKQETHEAVSLPLAAVKALELVLVDVNMTDPLAHYVFLVLLM
eukprot:6490015-Amphidinium_carterae.1